MVYDKQIFIGTVEVPAPSNGELITVYEQIYFEKHETNLDIMYFQDLDYGIAITDKMVDYYKVYKKIK